jgi:hypothetical protein
MPELIWLYLTALLYYRTSMSCTAFGGLANRVPWPLDENAAGRLVRANTPGARLSHLVRVGTGDLVLDDTVVPTPLATVMDGLAWVFSSRERKPVYGFSLVLLIWMNGTLRIPRGVRLWRRGGASKIALALELLSDARHRLRCRPEYGLFDA